MLQDTMEFPAAKSKRNGADNTTITKAPFGLSESRKKLRWLLSCPPTNNALRMVITPSMAAAMMEHNADEEWNNRPQSSRGLRRYVAAMQRGWKYTGEPIIFSVTGRLLNGQHRLAACIQANTSFECLIVFCVEDDAFKYMDIGVVRTAGHIFGIADIPNYNIAAAIARILYSYTTKTHWDGRTAEVENDELLDFYYQHEGIQQSITIGRRMGSEGLLPPRWGGFVHYVCAQKHRSQADEFFERVATGVGITKKTDPAHTIRQRLLKNARSGHGDRDADIFLAAYTLQAWNAHRKGEVRAIYRWRGAQNPHENFPRAI